MKQLMMLLGFLPAAFYAARAQSTPKIYAYSQEIIPGTRSARTVDENGKITEEAPATSTHYLLYIAANSAKAVKVTGVWVNGSPYAATLQKVTVPVTMGHPSLPGRHREDTLVGNAHQHVWQLQLDRSSPAAAATTTIKKAMAGNEVVVCWQADRKKGLSCAKTIKKLPAVALQ